MEQSNSRRDATSPPEKAWKTDPALASLAVSLSARSSKEADVASL